MDMEINPKRHYHSLLRVEVSSLLLAIGEKRCGEDAVFYDGFDRFWAKKRATLNGGEN